MESRNRVATASAANRQNTGETTSDAGELPLSTKKEHRIWAVARISRYHLIISIIISLGLVPLTLTAYLGHRLDVELHVGVG